MVVTPTFTAPIGDTLTRDRIRSSRDSRITSSRGPLWLLSYDGPTRDRLFTIADVVADDMGIIMRAQRPAPFLRPQVPPGSGRETVYDIGGIAKSIWLATAHVLTSIHPDANINSRIYELSPVDFTVRRQRIIHNSEWVFGMDGDDDVIYMVFRKLWDLVWTLWKLDAETFDAVRTVSVSDSKFGGVAGDKNGVWLGGEDPGSGIPAIYEYTSDLQFVHSWSWPLVGIGHSPGVIGGGSRRIYCTTRVESALPDWPAGIYIHTIKPDDFTVVRSYGPWVSGRTWGLVGGM